MKIQKKTGLDFIIDKLTNSIENTSTEEVFNTEFLRLIVKILTKSRKLIGDLTGQRELKTRLKKLTY